MTEKPLFDVAHLRRVLEEATGPDSKWNARSLSLAASAGKSPHLVRDIVRGKSSNPQLETILGLAKALGMDIAQLIPSTATLMPRVGMTGSAERLEVVGAVAAGVWREQTDWAEEDRYSIEVGPNPVAGGERFALRMEGHSMDKIIPPGSDLECLRVSYGVVEPQPGDIVIVQRDRHDLHELTCKRLDHDGTNFILRAESTRAEFQEPIVIGRPDEDHFGDDGINIIGIVLRSHQNLYQRRR
jgi:SOS-response transcriptional repressor LexA